MAFAGFVLLVAAAIGSLVFFYTPGAIQAHTLQGLHALGLKDVILPRPQSAAGAIVYRNIALDADGIDTIERLEIRYSPWNILFGGDYASLKISGMQITGTLEKGAAPLAERISMPHISLRNPVTALARLPFRKVLIEKSTIALLSEDFGGLAVDLDLQVVKGFTGTALQGVLKSNQKFLGFEATLNGSVHGAIWALQMDIDRARVNWPDYKFRATRMTGALSMNGDSDTQMLSAALDLRAGGMVVQTYPWQNASISLKHEQDVTTLYLTGSSTGYDGLELSLTLDGWPDNPSLNGSVFAQNGKALLDYAALNKNVEPFTVPFQLFEKAGPLILEAQAEDLSFTNGFAFKVKDEGQDILIDINHNGEYIVILSQSLPLMALESMFTERGLLSAGTARFAGKIQPSEKDAPADFRTGLLIKGGAMRIGDVQLENIEGALFQKNDNTMRPTRGETLSCEARSDQGVSSLCNLDVVLGPEGMKIKNLHYDINGRKTSLQNLHPYKPK